MRTATINAGEEDGRYVGQVYQEYYAGLRYYFLSQLGDASEADACVRETIDNFLSTEERRAGADAKQAPARLLELAGLLCSEKLAAKSARVGNIPGLNNAAGLLHKIMGGVIQPIKERLELGQLFQGRRAATHARG